MASVITKAKILEKLRKQAGRNKTSIPVAIVLMLCIGSFLLWVGATRTVEKSLAVALCVIGAILLALSVLMVAGYIKLLKSYRSEEHLQFWLTKDVCVQKKHRTISVDSGTDSEHYYLYFEKYGKIEIDAETIMLHDNADRSKCIEFHIDELFQHTNEGDLFYLVFTSASEANPCIAIPSSQWELPDEHTTTDGRIYLN